MLNKVFLNLNGGFLERPLNSTEAHHLAKIPPQLPKDVWLIIFSHLGLQDQMKGSIVCKAWKKMLSQNPGQPLSLFLSLKKQLMTPVLNQFELSRAIDKRGLIKILYLNQSHIAISDKPELLAINPEKNHFEHFSFIHVDSHFCFFSSKENASQLKLHIWDKHCKQKIVEIGIAAGKITSCFSDLKKRVFVQVQNGTLQIWKFKENFATCIKTELLPHQVMHKVDHYLLSIGGFFNCQTLEWKKCPLPFLAFYSLHLSNGFALLHFKNCELTYSKFEKESLNVIWKKDASFYLSSPEWAVDNFILYEFNANYILILLSELKSFEDAQIKENFFLVLDMLGNNLLRIKSDFLSACLVNDFIVLHGPECHQLSIWYIPEKMHLGIFGWYQAIDKLEPIKNKLLSNMYFNGKQLALLLRTGDCFENHRVLTFSPSDCT